VRRLLPWLCLGLLLAACGAIYSSHYVVAKGDTLYSIARANQTTVAEIRELNGLGPDAVLYPGDYLFLPAPSTELVRSEAATSRAAPPRPKPTATEKKSEPRPVVEKRPRRAPSGEARFAWPVSGGVTRDFDETTRGVDLRAGEGEAVRAAGPGRVGYAGTPARAYGGMVIVEHEGELFTVYSNLSHIEVERGRAVATGAILGTVSGRLHFEVRRGSTPLDPLLFLPPR